MWCLHALFFNWNESLWTSTCVMLWTSTCIMLPTSPKLCRSSSLSLECPCKFPDSQLLLKVPCSCHSHTRHRTTQWVFIWPVPSVYKRCERKGLGLYLIVNTELCLDNIYAQGIFVKSVTGWIGFLEVLGGEWGFQLHVKVCGGDVIESKRGRGLLRSWTDTEEYSRKEVVSKVWSPRDRREGWEMIFTLTSGGDSLRRWSQKSRICQDGDDWNLPNFRDFG